MQLEINCSVVWALLLQGGGVEPAYVNATRPGAVPLSLTPAAFLQNSHWRVAGTTCLAIFYSSGDGYLANVILTGLLYLPHHHSR